MPPWSGDDGLPDTGWEGAYDDGPITPALPPFDEPHERGVLGAILSQPDRPRSEALLDDLLPWLEPDDFFRQRNRQVAQAVVNSYRVRGSALIGDLWGARPRSRDGHLAVDGEWSAYLTSLVVDAHPGAVVRPVALLLADLGLERLLLETQRLAADPNPQALAALHRRVERKRGLIDAARTGERNTPTGGFAGAGMEIPE
jgi:hypothetical protein